MINDVAKTTIRETLDSFYTVLDLLRKGWCDNAETHAVVVKGDLARLTEAEQLEAVALMRALAAKDQKHGTTACEVVGIPLPKVGGLLDRYVIGGVVAELIGELQTANGAEYYSILEMTLELVALLQPMAREHSRDLLIDAGVRAAFIDTELKRRQDGRGPVANEPEADDYQSPTYHTTELGNARRLVAQRGADIRYCHAWGCWFVWDVQRWVKDETDELQRMARQTARSILVEASKMSSKEASHKLAKWAMSSESKHGLRAMVDLAQAEPTIPVRHTELDADPWLVNVQNGTLDLRTGELCPHRRGDLLTKLLPVDYDPAATCPKWIKFLRDVLPDKDTRAFVRRAVGYSLTGLTGEHCLFFAYGTGRNGKSTFFETLLTLLDGYAQKMPTETLMTGKRTPGGASPDIARLPGARLVVAAEVEEGRRLAESLVKDLSGGDTMTARFLRQEYFEFKPTHKLWMYGNHKPVIRGTDEGIWRRIHLIPFTVTIPQDQVDTKLLDKLKAELPGILAWAMRGCLDWGKDGLQIPGAVTDATRAYRSEMDVLGAFMAQRCCIDYLATARAGELYRAYRDWCESNGERYLTGTAFGQRLSEQFDKTHDRAGNYYIGVGLLDETGADEPPEVDL